MPFKRAQVPSQREILSLAEDWGKVVAHRAFGDEGPDLDLNFDAIEAVAFQAAQAVIKGTIQQSLSQQMRKLGETQSCPQCRRVCPVETEPRELVVRGATVQYDEPKCHCPTCRRDFFQRPDTGLELRSGDAAPSYKSCRSQLYPATFLAVSRVIDFFPSPSRVAT